jgi:hypothetical protein|tara:strand:- start:217 stop:555 length:339 start_codon:yes stop_codon:yes gene_type:complete
MEEAEASKKRKVKDEEGADDVASSSSSSSSSDGGVPGVLTDDGIAWSLGSNKMLRVKEFKGKTYIDIREFYEDKGSGEMKPGKKGISLSTDCWQKVVASLSQIQQAVEDAES